MEEIEDIGYSKKVFMKYLPRQLTLDELSAFVHALPPPANNFQKILPYGSGRAMLIYASPSEALNALQPLTERLQQLDAYVQVEVFRKNPPKPKKSKAGDEGAQEQQQLKSGDMPKISKQLGLMETIYVDGAQPQHSTASGKSGKGQLAGQPFKYVIVVDFEATCWENQAPPKWRESEIIEFPAVLVNLSTGKVEAEFHKFIMPIESPKLSAFCTELTGITQKQVDTAMPLQTALVMFQEWLRKELRARNLHLPKTQKDKPLGNCAFVSWTDWDFGVCLAKECRRKSLRKPAYFNQWIDLRAVYREWYNYRPLNFGDALSHVGMVFEGRQHSGIDDAKNLAALAFKMVSDGARLAITKDLTPFQLNGNCAL